MLSRFVASPTGKPIDHVDDPALVEDVRCLLKLKSGNATRDLLVGTQPDGALTVVDLDRSKLSPRCNAQLAFHEVAARRTVTLELEELWLFDLQVLELLMDAPGLNDAMYLYGTLRGPYPAVAGTPMKAIEGQLTVTRSDLLSALVDGVRDAFQYQPEAGGSRCVHALLPGERDSIIDGGRGVVLALPLAPAWSLDAHVVNDRVAAQMFYDVLGAFYRDAGMPNTLPVPSRAAVEHELVAAGWTIEGDVATRKTKKGGLLGFGSETEKKPLPREGVLEEYLPAAAEALAKLGPPSPETLALRRRRGEAPAAPIASASIPRATAPRAPEVSPAPVPARQPRPQVETKTDWMKDFVDSHERQGHKKPKVVAPARAVTKKPSPDWMNDFADPAKKPDED